MSAQKGGKGRTYGSDGGSSLCEHGETGENSVDALDAVGDLLDVAREFLSEGQRSSVLRASVSAPGRTL